MPRAKKSGPSFSTTRIRYSLSGTVGAAPAETCPITPPPRHLSLFLSLSQVPYWYNNYTGESTYDRPAGVGEGYESEAYAGAEGYEEGYDNAEGYESADAGEEWTRYEDETGELGNLLCRQHDYILYICNQENPECGQGGGLLTHRPIQPQATHTTTTILPASPRTTLLRNRKSKRIPGKSTPRRMVSRTATCYITATQKEQR